MLGARNLARRNNTIRRLTGLPLVRAGVLGAGTVFSRASPGAYQNAAGLLVSSVSNAPRFEGTDLALLMEPTRANAKMNSSDITLGAGWAGNQNGSYTSPTVTLPNGASGTVSQISGFASSGTSSGFYFNRISGWTIGGLTGHSMFLRNVSGATGIRMGLDNKRADFNLVTGGVVATLDCTAWMEAYGNGWWRCCIVYAAAETSLYPIIYNGTTSGTAVWQAWGLQVEDGGFVTSYAASPSSAQGVRSQDNLYLPLTAAQGQTGSITAEFVVQPNRGNASRNIFSLSDANYNELYINVGSGGQVFMGFGTNNGTTYTYTTGTAITPGVTNKLAVGWSGGTASFSVNGGAVQTQSGGITAPYLRLGIGCNPYYSTVELGGTLNNVLLFPTRMSDASLMAKAA